nr:site-specific integrase [Altererythrobacter lutimaris]
MALVKVIFGWAASEDFIDNSPADHVRKAKVEKARDRVLKIEEIAAIWRASDALGYPMGPWLKTLTLTAQRRTEVARMRWDDIDLIEATWTIAADETKADRKQLVPLSGLAIGILEAQPRMGEFVFTTNGETPVSAFARSKSLLDKFIAAIGEPIADWRFHDLRRTAATEMGRLGVAPFLIERVLNHAEKGVTRRVYDLYDHAAEKRHALETWAAEIDRVVNGERCENVVRLNG